MASEWSSMHLSPVFSRAFTTVAHLARNIRAHGMCYIEGLPNKDISFQQLSHKLVMLMALTNADRCSDLTALDLSYHSSERNGERFLIPDSRSHQIKEERTTFRSLLFIIPGGIPTVPGYNPTLLC